VADLDQTARRLAELLTAGGERLSDPGGGDLDFETGKAWWRCRNGVVGSNRRGTRPSMELQTRLVL
jgi:hypothetical protein